MFLDEVVIGVSGGNGGNGCVSWRREKYVPMGGPNGGDGGAGGDVVFVADANTDTLSDFTTRKKFAAKNGESGSGQNRAGPSGEDLILPVPPGTVILEVGEDGGESPIADLREAGERILAAQGGKGGFGNAHFKSSVRQRPDFAEKGEPGEVRMLKLELKLVADVGIIGYPNAGKSTLISVISAARPKIADYPFTTITPNLGVVTVHDRSFVVCDIPGLIEGASEGKGLGVQFLRHVERCGVLLHLLDLSRALEPDGTIATASLIADYKTLRKELEAYSPTLSVKREFVILNKIDLTTEDTDRVVRDLKKKGIDVFMAISGATRKGTDDLSKALLPVILEERKKRSEEEAASDEGLRVLRPHIGSSDMGAYRIEKHDDGSLVIRGARLEQFTNMTDFGSEGGVRRFRDVLERIGLMKAIRRERQGEAPVSIGGKRVEGYLE